MARYWFHLASASGVDLDEIGSDFDTLEAAYLDGCRAVVDISAEMLRERRDPSQHRFEIRDVLGRLVLELPWDEVLRPGRRRPPPPASTPLHEELAARVARSRELRSELRATFAWTRATLATAQATLDRSGRG